ncbi:hypothetical protein [Helicobacter fennelliae]
MKDYVCTLYFWIFVLGLFIALGFFSGCVRIVKEAVYVPTKCEINPPKMPIPTSDIIENQKRVLIYTEELESGLNFCVKGE